MQIFRFLRFFLRISNTVRSKQLVNSTVRIRIGIIRCSKPIWRWVFTTIYVMHLNIVDFIVSVVRNSTRLQSSQINWYFGSSDATAHKILPSSESCFKENWWCQPEERSGWNGKKKNLYCSNYQVFASISSRNLRKYFKGMIFTHRLSIFCGKYLSFCGIVVLLKLFCWWFGNSILRIKMLSHWWGTSTATCASVKNTRGWKILSQGSTPTNPL